MLRAFVPMRGSYHWVRLWAVTAAFLWVSAGKEVILPLAAATVVVTVVSTLAAMVVERRRDRPFELAEFPDWLVAADAAAIAAWVVALAADPEPGPAVALFAAVGAEAAFRHGARGAALVFAAAAATRLAQEAVGVGIFGQVTAPSRFAGEVLVTAVLILLFAAIIENYGDARRRQRTLERVATSFNAGDEGELPQRLVLGALEVIAADYAVLRQRTGSGYPAVAIAGRRPAAWSDSGEPRGVLGEVLRQRRTVQIDDYQGFGDSWPHALAAGVRVVLGAPVFVDGEVLACFLVARYSARPFDGFDRSMLEALAGHSAVALRNQRLLTQARRLEELSRELALAGDERALLQRISDTAAELLGAEFAIVAWLEPGKEGMRAASGIATDWWASLRASLVGRPPSGGALRRILERGERVVVEDYATWPEATAPADRLGLHALVAEPIVVDGRVIACLGVASIRAERRFSTEDLQFVAALASQASVAIRNARVREERERRLVRAAALSDAARQLASARDLRGLYRLVYEVTMRLVPIDSFYLALYDEERRQHTFVLQMDEGREWERDFVAPLGDGPTSDVVRSGRPYVRLRAEWRGIRFGNQARSSLSAVHVPLHVGDRVLGALSAQRYVEDGYTAEDVAALEALGSHVAAAIENLQLLVRTRELYLASVRALAAAVDARDPYTRSHSARTSALARAVAEEMGLPPDEVRRVQLAGLLHDVGKIGIPDAVLNKPGLFTTEERLIMMTHAALGGAILQSVEPLRELVPLVRAHHERYDGGGYPDGLAGDSVPLAAYIVAVADAFEVIVSKRAYKEAQSVDFAIEELRRHSGTQFHADAVEAFVRVVERDRARGATYLRRLGQAGYEELEAELPGPATLVEQFAAAAQRHMRQLAILQRIASEITAVLDIGTLADRLLRIVCEAMGYEEGFLLTLDPDADELVVRAAVGPSAAYVGERLKRGQGISWAVLASGTPANVPDVRRDRRFYGPTEIRSSLMVPLLLGEERIGVLGVESPRVGAFDEEDTQLLSTVSHQLAAAMQVAKLHQEVKTAAATDPLTGLANRRAFFEMLEAVTARARGSGRHLAVAIVDVNELKRVNDTLGHLAGDAALVRIGRTLAAGVRDFDLVARYGGDEFALIFLGASVLQAERASFARVEDVGLWRAPHGATHATALPLSDRLGDSVRYGSCYRLLQLYVQHVRPTISVPCVPHVGAGVGQISHAHRRDGAREAEGCPRHLSQRSGSDRRNSSTRMPS